MSTATTASPKQQTFLSYYFSPDSPTFNNAYQSAVKAGYSDATARNLTHVRPKWLSDSFGQLAVRPEDLTMALTDIIHNQDEPTTVRLKAIEMMMRHYKMFADSSGNVSVNVNLIAEQRAKYNLG